MQRGACTARRWSNDGVCVKKNALHPETVRAAWHCPHLGLNRENTSRECCSCGVVDANSRRSQPSFECVACGYASNADVNAARVIVKRAELRLAGSSGALAPDVDLQSALSSGRTRFKPQDAA